MNKQNFLKSDFGGKYPISANTFEFMQAQSIFLQEFIGAFGPMAILKLPSGSSTGLIIHNGELLPVDQTSLTPTQIVSFSIVEETEDIVAQGQLFSGARSLRKAVANNSYPEGCTPKSVFKDLSNSYNSPASLANHFMPKGAIIMWSGSIASIPAGYVLCDGRAAINGVTIPNLQGRFIVGYSSSAGDYHTIGSTGGEDKHTLTSAEMPQHRHGIVGEAGEKSGTGTAVAYVSRINDTAGSGAMVTGTYNTSYAGSGSEHENRPPYYVLAYLIKVI